MKKGNTREPLWFYFAGGTLLLISGGRGYFGEDDSLLRSDPVSLLLIAIGLYALATGSYKAIYQKKSDQSH